MRPLLAFIVLVSLTSLGCSGGSSGSSFIDPSTFDGQWSGDGGYFDSRNNIETMCASSSVKITQTETELHVSSIQTGCVTPLYPENKWKFQVEGNDLYKNGIKAGEITNKGFTAEDSSDSIEANFLASGSLHLTLSHSLSAPDYLLFGLFLNK